MNNTVWLPSKSGFANDIAHQTNIQSKTELNPKKVVSKPPENPWKNSTLPVVKQSAEIDVKNGKILGSTKWNAWRCVNNVID